jgi:hypothetical protein
VSVRYRQGSYTKTSTPRRIPQYLKSQTAGEVTTIAMVTAAQKLYPRATVKKIVKAHSKLNVSKNVDVLVRVTSRVAYRSHADDFPQVFLDYALFLQTYARSLLWFADSRRNKICKGKATNSRDPD